MKREVTIREMNQHLSQYIERMDSEEELIITRRGKPVAKLTLIKETRVLSDEQKAAWQRILMQMKTGYSLGGNKFNRDELHER